MPAPASETTPRSHRWIVGSIATVIFVTLAIEVVVWPASSPMTLDVVIFGVVGVASFTTVGTIILWQRPGHGIGRLSLAIGSMLSVIFVLRLLAVIGDELPGPVPPAAAAAAVISSSLPSFAILAGGPLMIAWFPDGRRTSRLGGIVEGTVAVAAISVILSIARPGLLVYEWITPAVNPLGVGWLSARFVDGVNGVLVTVVAAGFLLAAIDLLSRYRDSDPVRRAQIRWVLAAASLSALLFLATFAFEDSPFWSLWIVSTLLPPFAIAIAITRYHLYDIDRIVSRSIGYGLVTVVLFSLFAGVNLVLQGIVSPMTGENSLAVAASTLLVAGLFAPVRTRVQRIVDRRFNRSHYDAERTVAGFAGRLRDELDLPTLTSVLQRTAFEAVQPGATGVWLRSSP